MKKILFLITIAISLVPAFITKAYESWGSDESIQTARGCSGKDSCWNPYGGNIEANGVRISLYKKIDNRVEQKGESYDFLNNQSLVDNLKNKNIKNLYAYTSKKGKLSGTPSNLSDTIKNVEYGEFLNIVSDNVDGSTNIKNFFNKIQKNLLSKYQTFLNEGYEDYYFVVEPITIIDYYKIERRIYGTSYEQAYYRNSNRGICYSTTISSTGEVFCWSDSVVFNSLSRALLITTDDIINENKKDLTPFLQAAGFCPLGTCKSPKPNTKVNYKIENFKTIMQYTYGMNVFKASDIISIPQAEKKSCEARIESSKCQGSITINEPNDRVCVLGNNDNIIDKYKDQIDVYCSNSVTADFSNFYSIFNDSIRAGSYFPTNEIYLEMKNVKTCYIKENTDLANGWENYFTTNNKIPNNKINVTIGGRKYEFKNTSFDLPKITCNSNTNCSVEYTYKYMLDPLINRFISIRSMGQDECGTIDECKSKKTVYDNGTSKFTVPLNYKNGQYNYQFDLSNSLLKSFPSNKINWKKDNINATIDGKSYMLNYNSNKILTDGDLNFPCYYSVSDNPDDINNCENQVIPDGKCCIEGKIQDCPLPCNSECCDSNGKSISCPGNNSGLKNLVYRPISLTDPFPGIEGKGRTPGANWNGNIKINGREVNIVDFFIKNNRGYKDYEIYQQEPLYVIKLDAATIKQIRSYNKNQKYNYNDFELTCLNGEKCVSKFLRGETTNFHVNLIDRGSCKNINNYNFDNCIKKN